jgi:RES domain-containing protein
LTLLGWRIVKAKRLPAAFTGEGSRLRGGRWNSSGMPVVYTSQCLALAALEMLVHLRSEALLEQYWAIAAEFDETLVETLEARRLPATWATGRPPARLAELGDEWLRSEKKPVLRVPSAVVEPEFNFLLNPRHTEFASIRIGKPLPFNFDPRLAS